MTKHTFGRILIWTGVLAWVPYLLLNYTSGMHVPMAPFLAVHLIGILGGSALSGRRWVYRGRRLIQSVLQRFETP